MAIISEEQRKQALAVRLPPFSVEIDKSMVRRVAEAVGDDSPLWQDDAEARKGPNKGMVASPALLHGIYFCGPRPTLPFNVPLKRVLDGGGEWEYSTPIRPGDVLTANTRIVDLVEREGSAGSLLFVVRETQWTNQKGQLVAKMKATTILR